MASYKFTLCGSLRSLSRHFSTNQPFRSSGITMFAEASKPSNTAAAPTTTAAANVYGSSTLASTPEYPLPGNVTTQLQYQSRNMSPAVKPESCLHNSDVLTAVSNQQRQMDSLQNFAVKQQAPHKAPNANIQVNLGKGQDTLECLVHNCPKILKNEFADLFPNVRLSESPLTVLNLAQKTENDMGAWSSKMEAERDQLTADFINTASAVVDGLREAGYWADFIDPSSGRPYLGPFTNATLSETDGRLSSFGFSIEDLGCCKVINHRLWGRKTFVGTLFTTAPVDSPVVQQIVSSVQSVPCE